MITGFESDLAILLLAFALIFSAFIGWWTYSGNKRLPEGVRWLNISLRSLAIFILLLLLFNPVYEFEDSRTLKNDIAVLIDNSRSTTIEKGEWKGEESMRDVIRELNLSDTTSTRYRVYGFDSDIFRTTPDSLPLDGSITDINRSLNSLHQAGSTPDAIILVTDGIFNRGLDPTRAAERIGAPFFTVAVGDTTAVRDVLVRNVFYNSTAFTNTTGSLRAEILNDGFPDRSIEVQLYRNNELAAVQTIQTTQDRSVHNVEFEVDFTEEGTERFRVEIPELGEEWTTSNNAYSFTIDVLDDQVRILHLAFEIHPDVSSLRNLLATDESILAEFRTWTGGDRFIGGSTPASADTLDLIIFHGFPHRQMDAGLRSNLAELAVETNLLLLTLPGTDLDNLQSDLQNTAPIRQRAASPVGVILPELNAAESEHAIFDFEVPGNLNRGPELRGPVRNYASASLARDLIFTNHRNETTDVPMLSVQQLGNNRVSQLNAWQWHRWQQSTSSEHREFYRNLMNNLVKWTSTGVSDGLLEFSPSRSSFDEGEAITFRASVQTETGQPDNEARVSVQISGEEFDTQDFVMRSLGSGRFRLETRPLPAGTYRYEAVAQRGSTEIDRQNGSFTVNESIVEFMDTMRRDELLRFIAETTDGAFFTSDQTDLLRIELQSRGFDEFRTETFTSARRAHHSGWWFLAVILIVGVEWSIRKVYDVA